MPSRKGKRAESAALKVECVACGANVGEPCQNYAGVNCAPHAARERLAAPPAMQARRERPGPVKMRQGHLFAPPTDAQREGGL